MAKFGTNMKMTVSQDLREQTRAVFEGVLGCQRVSPNDTIDLFAFEDGASIAVDYVESGATLTPEQHRAMGTWIEIEVDDNDKAKTALGACEGLTSFEFVTEHAYFQLPGGQVFRLKEPGA